MIEKFNKNAKVEKFTNMLRIAVRLIVIDPFSVVKCHVADGTFMQKTNNTNVGKCPCCKVPCGRWHLYAENKKHIHIYFPYIKVTSAA